MRDFAINDLYALVLRGLIPSVGSLVFALDLSDRCIYWRRTKDSWNEENALKRVREFVGDCQKRNIAVSVFRFCEITGKETKIDGYPVWFFPVPGTGRFRSLIRVIDDSANRYLEWWNDTVAEEREARELSSRFVSAFSTERSKLRTLMIADITAMVSSRICQA